MDTPTTHGLLSAIAERRSESEPSDSGEGTTRKDDGAGSGRIFAAQYPARLMRVFASLDGFYAFTSSDSDDALNPQYHIRRRLEIFSEEQKWFRLVKVPKF